MQRMLRNKYTRIAISSFLILMALWVATPRVYIHNLFHHTHPEATTGTETKVKSATSDDCDFDKYDKPVYFNIFKFIISFIPVKAQDDGKVSEQTDKLSSISHAIALLRAPPVTD
jgi:hypothetical protein